MGMINTDLTPAQVRKGFARGITHKASKATGSWEGGQGCVEGRGARVELLRKADTSSTNIGINLLSQVTLKI